MSDMDAAMAVAVAAAEKLEGEAGVVKGPTGPPRQSLGRPKVSSVVRLSLSLFSRSLFSLSLFSVFVFLCLLSLSTQDE